jgi:hypothetical protein
MENIRKIRLEKTCRFAQGGVHQKSEMPARKNWRKGRIKSGLAENCKKHLPS